jgi:hypothetical protein
MQNGYAKPSDGFSEPPLNPKRELMRLPPLLEQVKSKCRVTFDKEAEAGCVNPDNYPDVCEQVVSQIVDEFGLVFQNEHEEVRTWNNVYASLMAYAERRYP